jgi:hypothetical protein
MKLSSVMNGVMSDVVFGYRSRAGVMSCSGATLPACQPGLTLRAGEGQSVHNLDHLNADQVA